ncbi:MAG: lysylphosphatidylglycerol synthase transmembrane domain-containing protein [Polyangiaceae bacterium]
MSRGRLGRYGGRLLASLIAGVIAVWLLHAGGLPLVPSAAALRAVAPWSIAVYTLGFSVVHLLRAVRWHWLLRPVGEVSVRRLVNVSFIGFAAIVLLPLRSGEFVRPVLIRKDTNISGWAATGTIAAERVIDGMLVSLLLLVGLLSSSPLDPLPDHIGELAIPAKVIPGLAYSALALFGCAFAAMGLFYARHDLALKLVGVTVARFSPKLAAWSTARVEQLASGLGFLPKASLAWPFLGLSLLYWIANAGATYALGVGCGLEGMNLSIACVSMGVLALGILLPNAPGYFGAFQVAVYASLAMFFHPSEIDSKGAAFVFVQYVVQTTVTLGAALFAWWMERTRQGLNARNLAVGEAGR